MNLNIPSSSSSSLIYGSACSLSSTDQVVQHVAVANPKNSENLVASLLKTRHLLSKDRTAIPITYADPSRRSVAQLPELVKQLDRDELPFKLDLQAALNPKGILQGNASFSRNTTNLQWNYYPDGTLELCGGYLANLPSFIKAGDPKQWPAERGIPTMSLLKSYLINEMALRDRVTHIKQISVNPQTQVDINYEMLCNGKPFKEACALTHSAMLTAELGEMLGGSVHLVKAESILEEDLSVTRDTYTATLDTSSISEDRKDKFYNQDKIARTLAVMQPDKEYTVASFVELIYDFRQQR